MTGLEGRELDPVVGGVPEGTADLTWCDREPIHVPGAIQPHGMLLAVGEEDLIIEQASANAQAHIGTEARALIGAPLSHALGSEPVARLRAALENPRATGEDPLAIRVADIGHELTWHRVDGRLVVELEPADTAPALASTLFEDVRYALDAFNSAPDVGALCDAAAAEVKRLTGYGRVMAYRFHPDAHGEVVAEAREPGLEPYLGLHYPASDIPQQARRMYLLNQLRVIVDVDYEPVPLIGSAARAEPLNMTFARLRSVSPLHLAYLRNMGVQATLTISLLRENKLWGMLACHHHAPKQVGGQLRAACGLLGQIFSLHVVTKQAREQDDRRIRLVALESELVARMERADPPASALALGDSALKLTAADGLVARVDGHTATTGIVPPTAAVDALLERLRAGDDRGDAFVSDALPSELAAFVPCADRASGVLAVALGPAYEDYALWFRREAVQTVTWAGDPDKPMTGDPTAQPGEPGFAQLGPRQSFDAWQQEVRGRSLPWQQAEVQAARSLAAAVPQLLLARARDRLAHMALYDTLTGLPNRSLLLDRVEHALERLRRSGQRVALLFVDLDRFKSINDSLGHAAGDALLGTAARRLTTTIRTADTVARLGGDEFVVLCEDLTSLQAEQLAERVVSAFRAPFMLEGTQATVTVSVGLALAGPDSSPAELLRAADTAMYRAKRAGRNAAAASP